VPLARLQTEAEFVHRLFNHEFYQSTELDYDRLIRSQTIIIENEKVKVLDNERIEFLCSLMWPYIDSYWVTCLFLKSLKRTVGLDQLASQIQWFADSLYEERVITTYESSSIEKIRNALRTLVKWQVLTKSDSDEISVNAGDIAGETKV
jgi:glycerone phosphate O-acyltransferase/fatty acyl-CoA reductase